MKSANDINSNENPDYFDSKPKSTSSTSDRKPNFSFASTYKPQIETENKFNSIAYIDNFSYKPISSFTVLNNENLPPTLSRGKPNAIVHPIRRVESSPHARYQRQNGPDVQNLENQLSPMSMTQLANELNLKLNYYTNNTGNSLNSGNSSKNEAKQSLLHKRPLFITTVPTGVFLPPAREPPLPWFLKPHVYAYASEPVVLKTNVSTVDISVEGKGHFNISPPFPNFHKHTSLHTRTVNHANVNVNVNPNPNRRHSPTITGGTHLTKHQFQQQLLQRHAKRPSATEPYKNVMFERRVVRGSNYGATDIFSHAEPLHKAQETRRQHVLTKRSIYRNQRNVLGTPPPVTGRKHEVIQTDKYLEEFIEKPPEFSVDTQTDLFMGKAPPPPYIPPKVGVDVGTEIGEGELFNFEAEAQPLIDILVDACLEQSLLEIAHEQELQALRKQKEIFLTQREAEMVELRRLEREEIRLLAEKERKLREEKQAKKLDEEMQKEVTAAKLLQGHIAGLLPEVLENLEPSTDALQKEQLIKTVCPWLTVEVAEEVGHIVDSREILTVIIQEIIKQRASVYANYSEEGSSLKFSSDKNEEEAEVITECCECPSEENDKQLPPCT